MIKILECGVSCFGGGIENYVYSQYLSFDKTKIHVDFINIYPNQKMAYSDEILANGSKVFDIVKNKDWNGFFSEHHGEYDAIIFNTSNPIFLPLYRAHKIGGFKRVIVHSHNSAHSLPWYLKMFTPLTDFYLRNKIELLRLEKWACSEEAGHFMFGKRASFEVIKNAIDIEKYRFNLEKRIEKRKELNIDDKTTIIGMVGRVSEQKNLIFGINAFAHYHKNNPNSVLVIIGGVSDKNELRKMENAINHIGLHVIYLGLREDVNEWYNAFDVFLFPSRFEGFGIVGLEAQISGLPCLFSNMIPKTAIVSDLVISLPIEPEEDVYQKWTSAMEWGGEMYSDSNVHNREIRYKDAIRAGFDIKTECKRVVSILESYCK